MKKLQHLQYEYTFPAQAEPAWKSKVDRWYQLDAYAYGLAQAYDSWRTQLSGLPSMIILASPMASNDTDRQFAIGGAISPSKFVHTLPNIRASSLCQVMNWQGPVLSLHRDPATLIAGLQEAAAFQGDELSTIWVLGVVRREQLFTVNGLVISGSAGYGEYCLNRSKSRPNQSGLGLAPLEDGALLEWLGSRERQSKSFWLPSGDEISREESL